LPIHLLDKIGKKSPGYGTTWLGGGGGGGGGGAFYILGGGRGIWKKFGKKKGEN